MAKSTFWQTPKRLNACIAVQYGPVPVYPFAGDSIDISLGGLYLKTCLPLNLDERLSIVMNFPQLDDGLSCEARVAWVNPALSPRKAHFHPGVGLEFINLSSDVEEVIKRFINWREHPDHRQTVDNTKVCLDKEISCDLHSSCAFYSRYKMQSYVSQYHHFVKSYCLGVLAYRCKRRLMVKTSGVNPPDNMSPTGHLIVLL